MWLTRITRLNTLQTLGIAVTATGVVAVVFLHNPIDGYRTESTYMGPTLVMKDCSTERLSEYQKLKVEPEDLRTSEGLARARRLGDLFRECFDEPIAISTTELPFSEWGSVNPLFGWFGSLVHVLFTIATLIAIGLIWVGVFQDHSKPRED